MWPPKKILCPTDFSEGSERAISQASEMAKQIGAAIYLLHVIPALTVLPTDPVHSLSLVQAQESLRIQFKEHLQDSAEQLHAAGVTARTMIGVRRCGCCNRANRRTGAGRSHRDCHVRKNRMAAPCIRVCDREGGSPCNLPGPNHPKYPRRDDGRWRAHLSPMRLLAQIERD